jgi:hypothetical protein
VISSAHLVVVFRNPFVNVSSAVIISINIVLLALGENSFPRSKEDVVQNVIENARHCLLNFAPFR